MVSIDVSTLVEKHSSVITYWFMFSLPLAMILLKGDFSATRFKGAWLAILFIFAVLIGYRHQVGGDWLAYARYVIEMKEASFVDAATHSDPGYFVVNWLVAQQDGTIHWVNTVCGIIVVVGLGYFARKQPLPWVGLGVAVPYLLVVVSMGYTRQSGALGFAMIALAALGEQRVRLFVFFVLCGALFHKSALLLLPISALASSKNRILTILWVGVTGAVATNFLLLDEADKLWENYVVAEYSSTGGLIRVLMNAVPSVFLILFRNRLFLTPEEKQLWLWMAIFSLVCIPLVVISSTATDRMALYFIPIQIFVFSRLPLLGGSLNNVHAISVGVQCYYAAVLFVWLNFGSFSHAWLPYQNYLFMEQTTEFGPVDSPFPFNPNNYQGLPP